MKHKNDRLTPRNSALAAAAHLQKLMTLTKDDSFLTETITAANQVVRSSDLSIFNQKMH